jgi:hypothetical protein
MKSYRLLLLAIILVSCASYPPRTRLSVPHRSGDLIVSTSVSMVLQYYGQYESKSYISRLEREKQSDTTSHFANVVAVVQEMGYHWRIEGFALDHNGFEESMNAIRRALSDGRPLIISTETQPWGMAMVAIGYDDDNHTITLLDPKTPDPGVQILSYQEFENFWREAVKGKYSNHRWMIATWPKR